MSDIAHHYQTLEIEPGASQTEIKQAYRDLAQIWHPDRFSDNPRLQQKAEEKLKRINAAYEFLKTHQAQASQNKKEPKHKPTVDTYLNCEKLKNLLELEKWKDADNETKNLLLKLARRDREGWLRPDDIENISNQSLLTINQLWTSYSDDRFGFSVQSKIWRELGCKSSGDMALQTASENRFGKSVRWYANNMWLSPYDSFSYNSQLPEGSLPRNYIFTLSGWWSYSKGWTGYLLWRFDEIFLKL